MRKRSGAGLLSLLVSVPLLVSVALLPLVGGGCSSETPGSTSDDVTIVQWVAAN